jgi:hypothetical protein
VSILTPGRGKQETDANISSPERTANPRRSEFERYLRLFCSELPLVVTIATLQRAESCSLFIVVLGLSVISY